MPKPNFLRTHLQSSSIIHGPAPSTSPSTSPSFVSPLESHLDLLKPTTMSRFFRAAGDSDSDSSSSEEEELMTSDDDAPKQAAPAAKPAMSRFLKTAADSDSSDESSDEETHNRASGSGSQPRRQYVTVSDDDELDVRRNPKQSLLQDEDPFADPFTDP